MDVLYSNFHGCCFWCKAKIARRDATRDHVIPKSKGGADSIDNFVLSCQSCNNARGDMDAEEWLRLVMSEEAA
jgi:5-methylcytosine-specific restriction endonuclease McrA